MEKLIKKLNEVVEMYLVELASLRDKLVDAKRVEADFLAQLSGLDEREKELKKREKKVKDVEDVYTFEAELRAKEHRLKQAEKENAMVFEGTAKARQDLEKEKDKFENYKDGQLAEIEALRKAINNKIKAFEEEQETYQAKLIKSLGKK